MHSTAIKIISKLSELHTLTSKEKEFINKEITDATSEAYEEKSNGCDCYQPSCGICN